LCTSQPSWRPSLLVSSPTWREVVSTGPVLHAPGTGNTGACLRPQRVVISQHVGQLRGRIEGFCALHLKLRDFFALLLLKPKSDRISLREGMVSSRSAKDLDMTSFVLLLVGKQLS
jgi:hypothetical protein